MPIAGKIELEVGKWYKGNYTDYKVQSENELITQQTEYKKQQLEKIYIFLAVA